MYWLEKNIKKKARNEIIDKFDCISVKINQIN